MTIMTTAARREYLRSFLATHCLLTGAEIKLSAGGAASFYFDCKRATLDGGFLAALADYLLEEVASQISPAATVVGGPTLGADFIAAAVAMRAHQQGARLTDACIIRKEPKKHGTKSKIENEPATPSRVLVVEDVITTGSSIAKACDELLVAGHSIAAIAAIIDREAGGKQALEEKYGAPVFALFNRSDFPQAAGE